MENSLQLHMMKIINLFQIPFWISAQHAPDVTRQELEEGIKKYVIDPIIPQELITKDKDIN